jgi:choline dehydrogenase-like flavoprotein
MDYDCVIVGAGSADRNPPIHMPAGIARPANNRRLSRGHVTRPEPALHGRRLEWPQRRALDGSRAINAMYRVRGLRVVDASVMPSPPGGNTDASTTHAGGAGPAHGLTLRTRPPAPSIRTNRPRPCPKSCPHPAEPRLHAAPAPPL